MSILTRCSCGRQWSVPDGCAGQILHCVDCQRPIEVPPNRVPELLTHPHAFAEAIRESSTPLPGILAPYLPARGNDILIWRFSTTYLSLLVVADDYIAWANEISLEGQRVAEDKLQRTGDPRILVRWGATVLGADDLVAIRTNQHARWLEIQHHQKLKQEINFTSKQERDRFFEAAAQRLRLERKKQQYSLLKAAVAPALGLLLALACTGLCMMAAAEAREHNFREGPPRSGGPVAWFVNAVLVGIGPTRFEVLGLCVVAGLLVWMLCRVLRPPLILTLFSRRTRSTY
jgi:hypothetical protein